MKRQPGWISRADRETVALHGIAVLGNGRPVAVRLANLSTQGCEVQSDEDLKIGDQIRLQAATVGDVAASVRWSFQGRAGLRFAERGPDERI